MPIQTAEDLVAQCEERTARLGTAFDKLMCLQQLNHWLAARHREIFHEWLDNPLERQYEVLADRFRDAAESGTLSDQAFSLSAYSKLLPPPGSLEEAARALFFANLHVILDVLKEEFAPNLPYTDSRISKLHEAACNASRLYSS